MEESFGKQIADLKLVQNDQSQDFEKKLSELQSKLEAWGNTNSNQYEAITKLITREQDERKIQTDKQNEYNDKIERMLDALMNAPSPNRLMDHGKPVIRNAYSFILIKYTDINPRTFL